MNQSGLHIHGGKWCVMDKRGREARDAVESVLRLRGLVDDSVVFPAHMVLYDILLLEGRVKECEESLT